jgi:hypothetical protein
VQRFGTTWPNATARRSRNLPGRTLHQSRPSAQLEKEAQQRGRIAAEHLHSELKGSFTSHGFNASTRRQIAFP